MKAINTQVGKNIKRRRNLLSLSQKVLADKVDLSRASIANIEAGKQGLSVKQLFIFAKSLKTKPVVLIRNC